MRTQQPNTGYSNLISHLDNQHTDWKESIKSGSSLFASKNLVTEKAKTVYGWIDWKITDNREYEFCEKEITRKYSNLGLISVPTLQTYISKLPEKVEKNFEQLPNKFGLLVDGWTHRTVHYFAIFAVYEN